MQRERLSPDSRLYAFSLIILSFSVLPLTGGKHGADSSYQLDFACRLFHPRSQQSIFPFLPFAQTPKPKSESKLFEFKLNAKEKAAEARTG